MDTNINNIEVSTNKERGIKGEIEILEDRIVGKSEESGIIDNIIGVMMLIGVIVAVTVVPFLVITSIHIQNNEEMVPLYTSTQENGYYIRFKGELKDKSKLDNEELEKIRNYNIVYGKESPMIIDNDVNNLVIPGLID